MPRKITVKAKCGSKQNLRSSENAWSAAILQRADVISLGVKPVDGALLFNPPLETPIRAGDTWIIIGSDKQLKKLESLAAA